MVRPTAPATLTDEAIRALISERKQLPPKWRSSLSPDQREAQHRRGSVRLQGVGGADFELFSRQHVDFVDNFTVGLQFRAVDGTVYRLLRANGLHPGGHRNRLEGTSFGTSFHVHRATERYQREGLAIDGYAEQTDEYSSLEQAVDFLRRTAALETPHGDELRLVL